MGEFMVKVIFKLCGNVVITMMELGLSDVSDYSDATLSYRTDSSSHSSSLDL